MYKSKCKNLPGTLVNLKVRFKVQLRRFKREKQKNFHNPKNLKLETRLLTIV